MEINTTYTAQASGLVCLHLLLHKTRHVMGFQLHTDMEFTTQVKSIDALYRSAMTTCESRMMNFKYRESYLDK